MVVDEVKEPEKVEQTKVAHVDSHHPEANLLTVVSDKDGTPLSCYLMWTHLAENMNKFYVAQVLQYKNRQGPK